MPRRIERLRVTYEWGPADAPLMKVQYIPVSGGIGLQQLGGSLRINAEPNETANQQSQRILQRAETLAKTLQAFWRKENELEIEGSVVQIPLRVTGFKIVPEEKTVEVHVSGPGYGETRGLSLDALSASQRRLVESTTTTVERVAWEDFRSRLEVPAEHKGLQVFISYRKTHESFAEALARRLGDEGIIPWFDKWDILAGDSVPGEIEKGLQESVAFIPIITADYQEGTWATEELQSAIAKRVETDFKIIPVLLETCERPELIRHLRYVDFTAQDPETFESKVGELIDGIYGLAVNPFRR